VIAAFSAKIDRFFQRTVVESVFVPRKVEGQVERIHSAKVLLSSLSETELFPAPDFPVMRELRQGRYRGMKTKTITWDMPKVPAGELFHLAPKSTPPQATLFGQGKRPVWILVHGWLGGSRFMDEVFWPLHAIHKTADLVLIRLPGHGPRSIPAYSVFPSFPSRNPVRNVLGLLTAVTEIRELIAWLRESGYERIGVAGTSLGVQVAALLATVDPCAERFLFDRPLANLSDPLKRQMHAETFELTRMLDALEDLYQPVSPLSRPSRVSPNQVDVLLGREDHVVGLDEGEALAAHFGVKAQTFPTGHVLSWGREAVVTDITRKLTA